MAIQAEQQAHKREGAYDAQERAPDGASYENRTTNDIPALEWFIGAVGFVVVAGVILFLFHHAITARQSPPEVEVRVMSVARTQNGYLVTVKALNRGGSTAAKVVLEALLRKESAVLERSHTMLDYSPPGSERQAGLFFTRDPRQFELQVRALGYVEP
jgi:uncharacterized protein (TIGR02588 family)